MNFGNFEIEWSCPRCKNNSVDNYAIKNLVVCADCGYVYQWGDVLSENELQRFESDMFAFEQETAAKSKETTDMTTPLFEHDCEKCIYLGQYNGSDLYYHPGEQYIKTVIARHSSEGRDYSSGLAFAKPYTDITGKTQTGIPELVEARNRAIHAGLLSE